MYKRQVLGLPLLPPGDMLQALQEIRSTIHDDDQFSHQLHQLLAYVKRQTTRSLPTRAKSASLLLVLASHCQSVIFQVRQIQVRHFPVLHFQRPPRLRLYTSVVLPTAIYAGETWTSVAKTRHMLDVFNRR